MTNLSFTCPEHDIVILPSSEIVTITCLSETLFTGFAYRFLCSKDNPHWVYEKAEPAFIGFLAKHGVANVDVDFVVPQEDIDNQRALTEQHRDPLTEDYFYGFVEIDLDRFQIAARIELPTTT